ncbi:MAG: prolyl oligopeptidase family serine peptidase, partial [Candidatus Neomarinimicrobiota bacterium]
MLNLHLSKAVFLSFFLVLQVLPAQEIEDPYLWLEEVESESALNWVKLHNGITEETLKKNSNFQEIYAKNLEIYNSKEKIPRPSFRGKYIYNFWQDDVYERGIWRRTSLREYKKKNIQWETLLDIGALSEKEQEKWVYKGVSTLYPGDKYAMVELSRGGGDAVVIREYDLIKKEFVENGFILPEAKGDVSWKDENTLIVSTNFGDGSMTDSGYPRFVKQWQRGTALNEAGTLFEGDRSDVGSWGNIIHTPERQYVLITRAVTFYKYEYYTLENGNLMKIDIPEDADLVNIFKNQIIVHLKTDWTAAGEKYEQGQLISLDYGQLMEGKYLISVIISPDEKSSYVSSLNTKNLLLVNMLNNVSSELYQFKFRRGHWLKEKVKTPDFGNISLSAADKKSNKFFFTYSNFLTPSTLFLCSGRAQSVKALKSMPEYFDTGGLVIRQKTAVSKDGTSIPYFLIHKTDLVLDGANPTLLYGYGGFEISETPFYSGLVGSAWLERGGVFALANIRGGGEFGPAWHLAALKENRQKAYDDFLAIAQDLINKKITTPNHLGIMGGSNGGLLVGVAFTQRPDLFNAVVCQVPLLDMKRFNKLLAGASWMGEYGNPDKPEEWAFIKKYSPYHNLYPDLNYPKV